MEAGVRPGSDAPRPPGGDRVARSGAGLRAQAVKSIGGLVALAVGLVVLGLVAGGAIIAGSDNATKVATAAFGVIGSTVGAYFGVKVGTDGTQKAIDGQREEATKAQVFAAHVPAEQASTVVQVALAAARGEPTPVPDSSRAATPPGTGPAVRP